jgi:hypothetical protein
MGSGVTRRLVDTQNCRTGRSTAADQPQRSNMIHAFHYRRLSGKISDAIHSRPTPSLSRLIRPAADPERFRAPAKYPPERESTLAAALPLWHDRFHLHFQIVGRNLRAGLVPNHAAADRETAATAAVAGLGIVRLRRQRRHNDDGTVPGACRQGCAGSSPAQARRKNENLRPGTDSANRSKSQPVVQLRPAADEHGDFCNL